MEGRLRQLNEGNAGIKNYLQLVESDSPEGLGSRSFQHVDNILAILESQFETIQPARDSLRDHVPTCATGITALREALRLSREPLTEKALDLDMALTYTEIADPKFTAVPESDAEKAPKIARETDRDSRAGELALFATLMRRNTPQSAWSIGPQLGVGVGDDPAIFLGAALGFGRWVKLSGGWSWQQVQDLARGLSIDKVIPGDGTIKTRDDFDNNYYVSLSITIDELPFFKAADD